MLALVKTAKGEGHLELRDVPEPSITDDEVLIEVKATGICGSDIHLKHDTFPNWPPVILGHEFAGEIVETGKNIDDWKIGDRVVGEPHTLHCGKCSLCRRGYIQNCVDKRPPGSGIDGAFTKYLKYPSHLLHRIPEHMPFEHASLVEPAANTVTHIIDRHAIEAGDFVVVQGPGPIGLLAAQTAKVAGAREVMIIGAPADEDLRLPAARKLGIDHVVNLSNEDPLQKCLELTDGVGADLVVECSGAPQAIAQTLHLVRRWGRICAIGLTGNRPVELDWDVGITKVATLYFNLSTGYSSWDKTIWMIADGKIDVEPIITHRLPLTKWEQGFAAAENLEALKVVLTP